MDSHCAMEQKQAVQKQADSMGISCRVWRIQNSNVELPEYGESKCLQQRMVLPAAVSGYEGEKGKGCEGGAIMRKIRMAVAAAVVVFDSRNFGQCRKCGGSSACTE